MKSLTLKSMSALALALVTGGVMTTTASADTFNKNSNSKIEYQSGKIDIVDPTDPDPDNPTKAAVPTFDFGQQTITSLDKTYDNVTAGSLKVTDLRGTDEGWKVEVTQTAQLKSAATSKELTGAKLKLNTTNTTVTADSGNPAFTAADLTPGVKSTILVAAAGSGNGATILSFADGTDSAQLEVPGYTPKVKEAYTADLVWTLTDSPA